MEWIRAVARITMGDGSHGTGFLISEAGLVLTAFHVVAHRQESLEQPAPVWRTGPISMKFGNPNDPASQWSTGDAAVYLDRYSIADDWILLEIPRPDHGVAPLPLAEYTEPRADNAFATFGFPTLRAETGGIYHGTVLHWDATLSELDAENLEADAKGGEDAGGISGAPCVVDNHAVGIIVRSLANPRGLAVTRSLYAVPIARAAEGLRGLVPWDDGKPVVFQNVVVKKLPSDPMKLSAAAAVLGLPAVREKAPIARRLLATKLELARDAIAECDLDASGAGPILERVAAMRLHADAVAKVRAPGVKPGSDVAKLPLLASTDRQIHKWYVQRAFAERKLSDRGNEIVVVTREPADAELASGTPVDSIVARARKRLLRRKFAEDLVDEMLSSERIEGAELWLVLVGENRPNVIAEVRDRLPNAQIILGLAEPAPFPAPYEELASPVSPVMTPEEQRRLVRAWQRAAAKLEVPIESEEDT